MNAAATIALVTAALALFAGLLARRLSLAPGCGEHRWFSAIAFAAGAYALLGLPTTLAVPTAAVTWGSRAAMATLAFEVWAWVRYSQALLRREPRGAERVASRLLLLLAALALVPGAMFGDAVVERAFPPLGVVYRQALTTAGGDLAIGALLAVAIALTVRFVRAWRARVPYAGAFAIAVATLVALGACDALATTTLLPLPYLLNSGFAAPLLTVAWVVTTRFVDSVTTLERLRAELVEQVDVRTRALSGALESLHQAEKLAALGQFASGVAHEVNSPAAVVTATLRYLAEAPPGGPSPADAAEAVRDALAAMERINGLVRNLVDAGRLAAAPSVGAAEVAPVVAKALGIERAIAGAAVALESAIPPGLRVRLRAETLEQILEVLLRNAAEAVPDGRGGRVEVRAERREGLVRITVRDDGAGMTPEVLRRAFDPFFTTKPHGRGSGLGLAVARGLVESGGGELRLESEPGRGTRAIVELPEAIPTA